LISLSDPFSILWNHMSWGLQRPSTARCTQRGTEARVERREAPNKVEYLVRVRVRLRTRVRGVT